MKVGSILEKIIKFEKKMKMKVFNFLFKTATAIKI